MSTAVDTRMRNEALLDSLMNYPAEKRGASAIDSWTRVKIYESSFYRNIFQPVQIADSDLDRTVESDKPVKIIDKMPWLADTEVGMELVGLSPDQIHRALADKRRASGRGVLDALRTQAAAAAALPAMMTDAGGG